MWGLCTFLNDGYGLQMDCLRLQKVLEPFNQEHWSNEVLQKEIQFLTNTPILQHSEIKQRISNIELHH
jgi:hypothetical protein